jgi:hypothetical protein
MFHEIPFDIFDIYNVLLKKDGDFQENMNNLFKNYEKDYPIFFESEQDNSITDSITNLKFCTTIKQGFCEHNKRKGYCKDCGGSQICIHNKRKSYCKDCGTNIFCKHKINKYYCRECNGKYICFHNKKKQNCSICLKRPIYCKSENCSKRCIKKYDGYCKKCYSK